jgi:aminopeptidase N
VRDDDPDDVDYPYYVTAHELAHQWWAHQVVGANVQGATMLVETLAQYSALMVMKRKVGDAAMQRFLRYELDRYLIGRSTEQKKELPLARVENQSYIHYRKGSLVMYALQDYLGEERSTARSARSATNGRSRARRTRRRSTSSRRCARSRRRSFERTVDDLFETITLFDNRAVAASAKALPGGRYEVKVDVVAKKRQADELGKETDAPLDDLIDVGVLDADGKAIVRREEAHRPRELELRVHRRPRARARGHRPVQQAHRPAPEGQHGAGRDRP